MGTKRGRSVMASKVCCREYLRMELCDISEVHGLGHLGSVLGWITQGLGGRGDNVQHQQEGGYFWTIGRADERMAEYHICTFGVLYQKAIRQVIEESVESRREMYTFQYMCLSEGLPMRYCAPVEYDYSRYLNDRRAAGGWLYPIEERAARDP